MAQAVEFALYVKAVPGHAVPRYGTSDFIGAERRPVTKKTKLAGEEPIVWSDRIIPLTKLFVQRYVKEIRNHIAAGEIEVCTQAQWDAQCAADTKAEAAALKAAKAAEAAKQPANTDAKAPGKADTK